jgi:hypothetical protein
MSGYHPVLVVGETPKQYRIEAGYAGSIQPGLMWACA